MSQNNDFSYRLIKARVSEAIIKELFQQCGYYVYEYGMERTMPQIMDHIKDQNSEIAKKIRDSPDFVVQNSKNGKLFYLEVKYRWNSKFSIEDLSNDYPYENAFFVIVSKNDLQWISYELLHKGQFLSNKSVRQLETCHIFWTG